MTGQLRIGDLTLDSVVLAAPLAGVSDVAYRILARRCGAAMVWQEMVSAEGLVRHNRRTVEMLAVAPEEHPVAAQLFGSNPDSMARAAEFVSGSEVDAIDINMGCPVRKVTRNGGGAALLKDLDAARKVMEAVARVSTLPVTVKVRSGWDRDSICVVELAKMAEDCGLAAITVHPRTAQEGFSGVADWSLIGAAVCAVSVPVVGSGDVRSAEDAVEMVEQTGCAGVMVGRAAIGNPWLYSQIRDCLGNGGVPTEPSHSERIALAKEHLRLAVEFKGERRAVREMRRQLPQYLKGLPGASQFRAQNNLVMSSDAMVSLLSDFERTLSRCASVPARTETTDRAGEC
jgi:tRNA-dihydrouridine synthase B